MLLTMMEIENFIRNNSSRLMDDRFGLSIYECKRISELFNVVFDVEISEDDDKIIFDVEKVIIKSLKDEYKDRIIDVIYDLLNIFSKKIIFISKEPDGSLVIDV